MLIEINYNSTVTTGRVDQIEPLPIFLHSWRKLPCHASRVQSWSSWWQRSEARPATVTWNWHCKTCSNNQTKSAHQPPQQINTHWNNGSLKSFAETKVLNCSLTPKFNLSGYNLVSHGVQITPCHFTFCINYKTFNGLFYWTTRISQYKKGKTSLDLNKAGDYGVLGCSSISWTICKQFAPCSKQITMPTPCKARCSSWRPTSSVKALKAKVCIN